MRGRRWWTSPMVVLAVLLAACGSRAGDDVDVADIYAAAIRAVATTATATPDSEVVYVTTRADGKPLPLEVQAGIIAALDELTVRFVDNDDEAIDEDQPLSPVVDGMLVRVSPVATPSSDVTLALDRYRKADDHQTVTVRVTRTGDDWTGVIVDAVPFTGR